MKKEERGGLRRSSVNNVLKDIWVKNGGKDFTNQLLYTDLVKKILSILIWYLLIVDIQYSIIFGDGIKYRIVKLLVSITILIISWVCTKDALNFFNTFINFIIYPFLPKNLKEFLGAQTIILDTLSFNFKTFKGISGINLKDNYVTEIILLNGVRLYQVELVRLITDEINARESILASGEYVKLWNIPRYKSILRLGKVGLRRLLPIS